MKSFIVSPILSRKSTAKYVAWVNQDKYKNHLLSTLTDPQLSYFIIIFYQNKSLAEHILFKKLFNILNEYVNIETYSKTDLNKLQMLTNYVSIQEAVLIYQNSINITKYNVRKLLQFIKDKDKFINKEMNIVWGPGNHANVEENINEHYKKHVLSNWEAQYWKSLNCESYRDYAIESFYKIKNVMVHSNGKNVYLSGFYGNVFIIGRYEDDVFGISSCYYVESGVKCGRERDFCFEIVFNN